METWTNNLSEREKELVHRYECGEITEEQYEELMREEGWL